jgi:site-specific DNA recombinase
MRFHVMNTLMVRCAGTYRREAGAVTRAIVYTRVSLDATGEGLGVERQEQACRSLADARGWTVVGVESDNSVSAFTGKVRPAWQRVLTLVEAGEVDMIIAWHLDRVTRSMEDIEALVKLAELHGVGLSTVTGDIDLSSDTGRMLGRILTAVARGEVERKGARQRAGLAQRAERGRPWWSWRPFGYERDGSLRESEAAALRKAYSSILQGASVASIAAEWNGLGHVTNRGTPWRATAVRNVLLKHRNAAIRTLSQKDPRNPRGPRVLTEVGEGNWTPVVDVETFRAVVRVLGRPERRTRGGGVRQHLLTGLAVCGVCGGTVGGNTRNRPSGASYAVYECKTGYCLSHRMDEVDLHVQAYAVALLSHPEVVERHLKRGGHGEDAAKLREELTVLQERSEEIAEMVADGEFTREQARTANARIAERTAEIESRLDKLTGDTALTVWFAATRGEQIDAYLRVWYGMPVDTRRQILSNMFSKIELQRRGRGIRDFQPDRDLVVIDSDGKRVPEK